ncbi:hypothetical protein [Helicobacter labetoulli]|nr:hypothetical protein [Helicobacter labetoulli]
MQCEIALFFYDALSEWRSGLCRFVLCGDLVIVWIVKAIIKP